MILLSISLGFFGLALATMTALLSNPKFAMEGTWSFIIAIIFLFVMAAAVAGSLRNILEELLKRKNFPKKKE
ncbi:MAG: hypothetical protein Q7R84_03310 [bacterium]|nr:hypothetical protein [bacterium]